MSTTHIESIRLGGTASDVEIYKIGYGAMMMTWTPNPTPDEQAFESIKAAIDAIPVGKKLFLNSGEFYGINPREANLHLLARFFAKYPELTDRVFLSVKGGAPAETMGVDASSGNLRRSVDAILRALDGKKKLDLFEVARVDPKVSVEETMKSLKTLVDEGKFDHIGISEVSAETVKRANAIVGVAAVEIEVSPWAYELETKKVIQTTRELKIPVIAYSPLGRGFLTGKLNTKDINDFRKYLDKFQDEAAAHNQKIVDALTAIAEKKGISNAQLALAWVCSVSPNVVPIPGSSKAERVRENFGSAKVVLSEEDMKEISDTMDKNPVKGGRYTADHEPLLWG